MKRRIAWTAVLSLVLSAGSVRAARFDLVPLAGELWWGAGTGLGLREPFDAASPTVAADASFDLRTDNYSNQTAPVLVSNRGRTLWSDEPFAMSFTNGVFRLEGAGPFALGHPAKDLRGAFRAVAARRFPADGRLPDRALFAAPQWNTWVELTYNQNERDVLAYAAAVKANGFPGGVLMIDDTWQCGYGSWEFDPRRFRDPKGMIGRLHRDGWKVMLWVCPYVSMDSPGYRELAFGLDDGGNRVAKGGFIERAPGDPAVADWWNGRSAVLDLTHPNGVRWFSDKLDRLVRAYGVDGFKLDAGDAVAYRPEWLAKGAATPVGHAESYMKFGLRYPLNEYRAGWKTGGRPIVVRLADKEHSWAAVRQLIPDMIAAGLIGHAFVCPDMIGSGSWTAFSPSAEHPYDPEIFVRSAQIHALAPMMQFSAAPWRLLKGGHLDAVRAAAALRMKFAPYILKVAETSARSGEPMLRPLEYAYPDRGWAKVKDAFLLGDDLLVAPQTEKGAAARTVPIPPGRWTADDGTVFEGPRVVTVATPLARLPRFTRAGARGLQNPNGRPDLYQASRKSIDATRKAME